MLEVYFLPSEEKRVYADYLLKCRKRLRSTAEM